MGVFDNNRQQDIENKIVNAPKMLKNAEKILNSNGYSNNNKYIAVIMVDGDNMGRWISETKGDNTKKVSAALTAFSAAVNEPITTNGGVLIYSGGDDVLAVVPAPFAIDVCHEISQIFKDNFEGIESKDDTLTPTISAGIAIGHIKVPLSTLVKEAQSMEKVAKKKYGKNAFAMALLKRSGEILEWGAKFDQEANEIFKGYNTLRSNKTISAKFPYALWELLSLYDLDNSSGITHENKVDLIRHEFEHVCEQQCNDKQKIKELKKLCVGEENYPFLWNCKTDTTTDEKPIGCYMDFVNIFLAHSFITRSESNDSNTDNNKEHPNG